MLSRYLYSQILSQMADIFSSIISNNQNMVMKFLAAMTIIIAVPTVIAMLASIVAAIVFWRSTWQKDNEECLMLNAQ